MEHRRVWPLILGVQYNVLVEMYREAFASMGNAARRQDDTTNPHIDDDEQERLIDLPAEGEITSEVERMIREWQASLAADAARDAGRIGWRRAQAGGHVPFFIPTAPNRTTWAQVANRVAEASNAPHPESAREELLRMNPAVAEESRSTCQHEGCEFEGTDEEVRTHQENSAEGLLCRTYMRRTFSI
jgi:hypothetical protein